MWLLYRNIKIFNGNRQKPGSWPFNFIPTLRICNGGLLVKKGKWDKPVIVKIISLERAAQCIPFLTHFRPNLENLPRDSFESLTQGSAKWQTLWTVTVSHSHLRDRGKGWAHYWWWRHRSHVTLVGSASSELVKTKDSHTPGVDHTRDKRDREGERVGMCVCVYVANKPQHWSPEKGDQPTPLT